MYIYYCICKYVYMHINLKIADIFHTASGVRVEG